MKAIVCVKQVPDTSGKVAVKADGTLDRASMATITNPDDLNALEAALKLKDATGCEVVVITMGPPPAEGMLRELLARDTLVIQKRTKRKDLADVDIAPMIQEVHFLSGAQAVTGTVVVQAQNPGLNPQLLEKAIAAHLPALTPDFTRIRRRELLDAFGNIFR